MSAEFHTIKSVITEQFQQEAAMLHTCRSGAYTLDAPFVQINPYGIAPLTAIIHFTTPQPETPSIRVLGKKVEGDLHFTFPAATEHYLPVYGLYAGMANTVKITLASGKKHTLNIETVPADPKVIAPTSIATTAAYLGQNMMFLSPTTPAMMAAYDYQGDVRWYCTLNLAFDIKRAQNGHLLVGSHRLFMPPYHTTGLFEMGMVGKIYKEFRLPGGYHHDHIEMEDGNLLVLTQEAGSSTVEDVCVLLDRSTGEIKKSWDFKNALPQNVGGSCSQDAHDWFHNNSVWYDKPTNSLVLSGRHQDAIISLDYETGALNWVLGTPESWPKEFVEQYFFTPASGQQGFEWQWAQHGAIVTPQGDIMCFDNGQWRSKTKEQSVPAKKNYSRGVRFRLNTKAMEVEQLWQFGKERGESFYSSYISNVEYYAEGHYMVHSGGVGTYKGETCNLPPTRFRGDDLQYVTVNSITVEVKDDAVMYEMQIPGNYYRAEKLPLYCQGDALEFGKGQMLGGLGVTEQFSTIPDVPEGGEVPAKYKLSLAQEEDRLVMKGSFEKGQLVMLLLEGKTTHAYFIPTTKRPFLAMCVGTFLDADERSVEYPISFEGLQGNFTLSVIIDEYKYATGTTITV